jgi:hypothetical protein
MGLPKGRGAVLPFGRQREFTARAAKSMENINTARLAARIFIQNKTRPDQEFAAP